jgi:exonuclease VII small subunit
MANIQEKLDNLYKELETSVNTYNEALGTVNSTKEKIIALQGAMQALRDLLEEGNVEAAHAVVDAN